MGPAAFRCCALTVAQHFHCAIDRPDHLAADLNQLVAALTQIRPVHDHSCNVQFAYPGRGSGDQHLAATKKQYGVRLFKGCPLREIIDNAILDIRLDLKSTATVRERKFPHLAFVYGMARLDLPRNDRAIEPGKQALGGDVDGVITRGVPGVAITEIYAHLQRRRQ